MNSQNLPAQHNFFAFPVLKNRTKTVLYIVLLVLGLIVYGVRKSGGPSSENPGSTVPVTDAVNADKDWRHHRLMYTKHARCRMECRDISESEVNYILENGTVNKAKSTEEGDEAEGHCPTYALEGNTSDGQHVRIVFGACDAVTRVITAIDLGVEHECDCR
jgi:hypothetical protein